MLPSRVKNKVGHRYGKLTVIGFDRLSEDHRTYWNCKCDCGNELIVVGSSLTSKNTTSCGCYAKEFPRKNKLNSGEAAFNALFRQYKYNAKARGYCFELDKEYFRYLVTRMCSYCDEMPKSVFSGNKTNGTFLYNGIDRMDNVIGYTKNNCTTCCIMCNKAKDVYSLQEFYTWIDKINRHRSNFAAS
jgi:hypothetical protein